MSYRLNDMTDEELVDHYSEMAHLPIDAASGSDKVFFGELLAEIAHRFSLIVYSREDPEEPEEAADDDSDNGLLAIIGDDGVARVYDDTYDITIHCENKTENEEVLRILRQIKTKSAELEPMDYWKALTDRKFLKANYGINDIDIQFLHYFTPEQVVKDWKEMHEEALNDKG